MFALPEPAQQFAGADGTAGLEAACRAAVTRRDREADGAFVYAVRTTGIYCRPSCASRPALPHNLLFFPSPEEAAAAGFRPCKRCKPDGPSPEMLDAAIVEKACRLIEASEEAPSLAELAEAAGLSPGYFHRVFRRVTGLTPKAYAAARRAERVREALGKDGSVTEAFYSAGFNSSGRFYEQAPGILGMTPGRYKTGGADEELRFAIGQSSLGAILVASSTKGVAAILMGDYPNVLVEDLQDRFPKARLVGGDEDYERFVARVVGLVETPHLGLDLPLDVRGTAFQQRVWQALREIPAGRTASYAEIAERIGARSSVRAVAGACAANNIALAIPCHRVVRTDGALSGYAWGVERKRTLIGREAAAA